MENKVRENNQGRSAQYALKAIKSHYENLKEQGIIDEKQFDEAMEVHGAIVKNYVQRAFGMEW